MKMHDAETGARNPVANDGQYVEPDEFLVQMMSRRRLLRCDVTGTNVRGLLDPQTGRRILVEESRLLDSMHESTSPS